MVNEIRTGMNVKASTRPWPWEVQKHCLLIIVKWKVHWKLPFLFSTRYLWLFHSYTFCRRPETVACWQRPSCDAPFGFILLHLHKTERI